MSLHQTMKYFTPILFFSLFWFQVLAQQRLKIYSVREKYKTILYAVNKEFCPITLSLHLQMTNVVASTGDSIQQLIPPNTTKFKLTELKKKKSGNSSYTYHYQTYYGDVNQQAPEDDFIYDLPFKKGLAFSISQGYNGLFSHQNENALDFDMPIGTDVLATREGIVVAIEDQYIGACLEENCRTKANYVLIYHQDGSFGNYAHIQYHGSKVKVGDWVEKGTIIARSGNTGFTKGPHLHFECYLSRIDGKETVATKFRVANGKQIIYIIEGKTYKRNY